MARRHGGLRGIKQMEERRQHLAAKGQTIVKEELEEIQRQLGSFKENLQAFALKHKREIQNDPDFRRDFNKMCQHIGVDPLASNKGYWSELLGLGNFYYKLGVQVVEVCLSARGLNGGLMYLEELHARVLKRRGKQLQAVSKDDVIEAVKRLNVLGNSFSTRKIGSEILVQSVPMELNADQNIVLEAAQQNQGSLTPEELQAHKQWQAARAETALLQLVGEGLAWIDEQDSPVRYFFPSVIRVASSSDDVIQGSSSA